MNKELVIKQANLYLENKSLREIGNLTGVSHITVRDNLINALPKIDAELAFKVASLLEERGSKYDDAKSLERVKEAVYLCINEDLTVAEIARRLNTTSMVIYRDLTTRLERFNKLYPDVISLDMVKKVQETLTKHSINNSPYLKEKKETVLSKEEIMFIYRMFPSKDARYSFLSNCLLTFNMSEYLYEKIFGLKANDLYSYANQNNLWYVNSIGFVMTRAWRMPEKSQTEFLDFYHALIQAYQSKDKEKVLESFAVINDKNALNLKNQKKTKMADFTEDDIKVMLCFQLKYCLSNVNTSSFFNISTNVYVPAIKKFLKNHPKYESEYIYLINSNYDPYYRPGERKRG